MYFESTSTDGQSGLSSSAAQDEMSSPTNAHDFSQWSMKLTDRAILSNANAQLLGIEKPRLGSRRFPVGIGSHGSFPRLATKERARSRATRTAQGGGHRRSLQLRLALHVTAEIQRET